MFRAYLARAGFPSGDRFSRDIKLIGQLGLREFFSYAPLGKGMIAHAGKYVTETVTLRKNFL